MKDIIDLIPRRIKTYKPEEYQRLSASEKANVKSSRFVPPALGSNDFGKFVVVLKNPEYYWSNGEK